MIWLTWRKLSFVVAFTLAVAAGYAVLVSWWLGPLNASTGDRFQPGNFDQQGIVPVAYALFALRSGQPRGRYSVSRCRQWR